MAGAVADRTARSSNTRVGWRKSPTGCRRIGCYGLAGAGDSSVGLLLASFKAASVLGFVGFVVALGAGQKSDGVRARFAVGCLG